MKNFTPSLTVNVGGMFSGKSSELLRQGSRHLLRGHSVVYIKPEMDDRYSDSEVVTHDGQRVPAVSVDLDFKAEALDVLRVMEADVVLIDEIQFFNASLIRKIEHLLVKGKKVYCSGLDMDSEGLPFGITPSIMAIADHVNKLHAVCDLCGNDAYVTPRKDNKHGVQLGEKDLYYPVCRPCFYRKKGYSGGN